MAKIKAKFNWAWSADGISEKHCSRVARRLSAQPDLRADAAMAKLHAVMKEETK